MIPISDILIRSISGYVFMVPVFVLYFLWLKKLGRTQSFLHTAAVFVFGYYLFGLDRHRHRLYKQNDLSPEHFLDSIYRYDNWAN